MEWAGRLGAVARDHQQAAHARLAGEPVEEAPERLGGREVAHRQMRHRLEPGRGEARRLFDHLLLRPRRHRAEIHVSAGRQGGLERRDVVAFGRVASSEPPRINSAIAAMVSDAASAAARRRHCQTHDQSRLREIT